MLIQDVFKLFLHQRKNQLGASQETIKAYRYALRHFSDFMENRSKILYKDIERIDIIAWVEHMRERKDSKAWSVSRFLLVLKTLKAFFRWLEADEDCKEEGFRTWRERLPNGSKYPKRDYIPSVEDLRKWQKAFNVKKFTDFRNAVMFATFLDTGMRRGELVLLEDIHIFPDQQIISIPDGKTGHRVITITKVLAEKLKLYIRRKAKSSLARSKYLFPSSHNKNMPQSAQYVSKIFLKMCKRLELPKLTPHTLRHAFSTYYLINGGEVESLRAQTGHQTYESMLHYVHLAKVHGKARQKMMEVASPLAMLS